MHRRKRFAGDRNSGRAIRLGAFIYFGVTLALIIVSMAFYMGIVPASGSFRAAVLAHAPLFLSAVQLMGLGALGWFIRKCYFSRSGVEDRIATALQKMSNGDLGWKITLRRGDELADVADSVSLASESLADRISKMQLQTRQLTEIENYLIDSVDKSRIDPHTLKALRKLKICTSRLNANMEDFHISSITSSVADNDVSENQPVRELEKV